MRLGYNIPPERDWFISCCSQRLH